MCSMFIVNNKTPERLLLTLNIFTTFSSTSVVDFEQVFVCWVLSFSNKVNSQVFQKVKVLMLIYKVSETKTD